MYLFDIEREQKRKRFHFYKLIPVNERRVRWQKPNMILGLSN